MTDQYGPSSGTILEGRDRAPARAMLKAVGFSHEDLAAKYAALVSSAAEGAVTRSEIGR